MSGGHAHRLYLPGTSVVHGLPAQCKLPAVLAFVLVVVSTPREAVWAFAAYAVLLAGVAALARVPPGVIAGRMLVEVPFVVFALLLPFIATGERVDVLGVGVSVEGLWAAWNILVKATLGVVASILLAATTDLRELLAGLERLRMPALIVAIMAFMVRYVDVISEQLARMRIARESRGFHARHLGHARVLAATAGTLFIRSYERGERVHLAMLSRGYTGRMPALGGTMAAPRQWALAGLLPLLAAAVAVASRIAS